MAPRQPLLCEEPILCKSELPSRRSARARTRVRARARAREILARFSADFGLKIDPSRASIMGPF